MHSSRGDYSLQGSPSNETRNRIAEGLQSGEDAHLDVEAGPDDSVDLESKTLPEAQAAAKQAGFQPIGSMLYRRAHKLWSLENLGGGYALVRNASEPSDFPVDDQKKVTPVQASWEETLIATAGLEIPDVVDRYGVQVKVGDICSYTLGGEQVKGRIAAGTTAGYLDVQLERQVDHGVPADYVSVDRQARLSLGKVARPSKVAQEEPGTPTQEQKATQSDKENMDLEMHKSLEAKKARFEQHWASFGALLADEVLSAPNLSSQVIAKMNLTDTRKTTNKERIASWEALKNYSPDKADKVRNLVLAGAQTRIASKELNLPFAVAWDLRSDIGKMPRQAASMLTVSAKEMSKTQSRSAAVKLIRQGGFSSGMIDRWVASIDGYKKGSLSMQKIAIDQMAKDYWKSYFGAYGDEWVRDVKRRLKADLVEAKLKMQAVDDVAAKYWADFYGDYGDQLVGEVNRSVTKTTDMKPSRTAQADEGCKVCGHAVPDGSDMHEDCRKESKQAARSNRTSTPMPLPAPVARRDIFAGIGKTILNEQLGTNRVAMVKSESGYHVLIKSGNTQKRIFRQTAGEAQHEFGMACKLHVFG